jgi:hypothetical protein
LNIIRELCGMIDPAALATIRARPARYDPAVATMADAVEPARAELEAAA